MRNIARLVALPMTDTAPIQASAPSTSPVPLIPVLLAGLFGGALAWRRTRRTPED